MSTLLGLGIAIVVGFFIGKIIGLIKIPAVAGYIIAGVLLGKSLFNYLDGSFIEHVNSVSEFALAIIAFTIGGELMLKQLKKIGFRVVLIALGEGILAFTLVFLGMLALNQPIAIALLLGAVASATAPAATLMVLNELESKGPLSSSLIAVVAIDDVICLLIYAVASAFAKVYVSQGSTIHFSEIMIGPLYEIFGSILIGAVLGGIALLLLKYFGSHNEVLIIIVGIIFIAIGIAKELELSTLLVNMTLGIMITNLSSKRLKAFNVIEAFTGPLYISFFVIAGARLDVALITQVGVIGLVYTLLRMLGKVIGASSVARLTKAPKSVQRYIGFGLLSQIGVAVGLAIVISHEFSGEIGNIVITVLLATTMITEIVGPLLTKLAVIKSGEAYKIPKPVES